MSWPGLVVEHVVEEGVEAVVGAGEGPQELLDAQVHRQGPRSVRIVPAINNIGLKIFGLSFFCRFTFFAPCFSFNFPYYSEIICFEIDGCQGILISCYLIIGCSFQGDCFFNNSGKACQSFAVVKPATTSQFRIAQYIQNIDKVWNYSSVFPQSHKK